MGSSFSWARLKQQRYVKSPQFEQCGADLTKHGKTMLSKLRHATVWKEESKCTAEKAINNRTTSNCNLWPAKFFWNFCPEPCLPVSKPKPKYVCKWWTQEDVNTVSWSWINKRIPVVCEKLKLAEKGMKINRNSVSRVEAGSLNISFFLIKWRSSERFLFSESLLFGKIWEEFPPCFDLTKILILLLYNRSMDLLGECHKAHSM
jgi:hypothetical protein